MGKDTITALMGQGAEYQGQLNFKGAVRIDGRFLGTINSQGKLVLGREAYVEGTICVGELEVHGTLNGKVKVSSRTVLHETAKVTGSLHTVLLTMAEGALLQGDLRMGKDVVAEDEDAREHPLVSGETSVHISDTPVKQ